MATIRKRKNKHVVIYDYTDENGKRRQKWETFDDKVEAQKFKNKIELDKLNRTLVTPSAQKVKDFLLEWVKVHAKAKWQYKTYSGSLSMIQNHIVPLIGEMAVQEVNPKDIDMMFDTLRMKKVAGPKSYNQREEDIPCLSSTTLRHIYIIIKKAFDKAVDWKLIQSNPVVCDAPKKNKASRRVWDAGTFRVALTDIDDPLLHLAVHIAFICSLRIGETMGLTWDCINFDKRVVHIEKTLQRVSKEALALLPKDNLIFVFPPKMEDKKSLLILKNPKNESSDRFIYFPEPLKEELLKRKEQIEKAKAYLGADYHDFNLVFSLEDGFPIEPKLCERWFKKWQLKTGHDFPELIFHEIRHSSTTYKLGISRGDVKSVQGDTGHSSGEMVLDIYSHIEDNKRANLMNSIEEDFYGNDNQNKQDCPGSENFNELLQAIKKDPHLHQKVLDALLAHQD